MNNELNKILEAYKSGEKTIEETNEALKEAGANFFFDPNRNPDGGWTEEEMADGFMENTEPTVVLPDRPDISRKPEMAGMPPVYQRTKAGIYKVCYDELGYAVSAKLVK